MWKDRPIPCEIVNFRQRQIGRNRASIMEPISIDDYSNTQLAAKQIIVRNPIENTSIFIVVSPWIESFHQGCTYCPIVAADLNRPLKKILKSSVIGISIVERWVGITINDIIPLGCLVAKAHVLVLRLEAFLVY